MVFYYLGKINLCAVVNEPYAASFYYVGWIYACSEASTLFTFPCLIPLRPPHSPS